MSKRVKIDNSLETQAKCIGMKTDLQSLPKISHEIDGNRYQVVDCFSQLPKYCNGSLDFIIEPSTIEYLSLSDSFLILKLKVVEFDDGGKELKEIGTNNISLIPFISQTIIKQLQLQINNEDVYSAINTYYAYEAYLQTILNLSEAEHERYLSTALPFFK